MYRYSGGAFLSMNQIACNEQLGVDDIETGAIAVKRLQNSKVTISEDAVTITTEQFSVDIGIDEVQALRVDSDGVYARSISGGDIEGLSGTLL